LIIVCLIVFNATFNNISAISWRLIDCLLFFIQLAVFQLYSGREYSIIRNKRTWSKTLDCHWQIMERWAWTKNWVFCSGYKALTHIWNLQKRSLAWCIPNMLTIMVHSQAFCINTWQPPICHPGMHWAALWVNSWNLHQCTNELYYNYL
jgi:hypothetical protein